MSVVYGRSCLDTTAMMTNIRGEDACYATMNCLSGASRERRDDDDVTMRRLRAMTAI